MTYYVYILQNTVNNKVYIGQTNNIDKRRREHKAKDRLTTKRSPLYRAIRKYGFDNFSMTAIDSFESIKETDEAEAFCIQFLQSTNKNFGYNLAAGGRVNRNFKHSEKWKHAQSERKKIYYQTHKPHNYGVPMAEAAKEHLSQTWMGEKSPNAKFSKNVVQEIRRLYASGQYTQTKLSRMYQTSSSTISAIVRNKRYID